MQQNEQTIFKKAFNDVFGECEWASNEKFDEVRALFEIYLLMKSDPDTVLAYIATCLELDETALEFCEAMKHNTPEQINKETFNSWIEELIND